MSNSKKLQIEKLLKASNPSASSVTKPLKKIGDGNMKKGVVELVNYGKHIGRKEGMIKGGIITSSIIGVSCLIYNGVKRSYSKRQSERFDKQQSKEYLEEIDKEFVVENEEFEVLV